MEYLSTKYGLVTDNDPESENGQLFLAVYITLLNNILVNNTPNLWKESNTVMEQQLLNSETGISGLYHRNPDLIDRRIMSHDNLTCIMAWSYLAGSQHRFAIWKYLVRHLGTYDNSQGKSKQLSRFLPFNPSNFFIWGLCAESKLAYLFFPFFLVNLILACNKPKEDTSGKILLWVEMNELRKKNILVRWCFNYYVKKLTKQYGTWYFTELIKLYHGTNSTNFPINNLLGIGAN